MLTFYEMVGQRIIERLNELNWTQQNLADKLNISKQVTSKILNGEKKTTILEIRNIADILAMSVERLLSPIETKIELLNAENDYMAVEFMGEVSTIEGKAGIKKAMSIIDTILDYEEEYGNLVKLRKTKIDFSGAKKKRILS